MASSARRSWKRRLLRVAAGLMMLAVLGIASTPWLLGTRIGRRFVLDRVNGAIAPGRLQAESLEFSWSGPILARQVVLTAPDGKAVVSAPTVAWDRGLWRLLTDRPDYGTITLQGASCDVTRREDGTIDLVEALGIGSKPQEDAPKPAEPAPLAPSDRPIVALKIVGGSLRLKSPELPIGVVAPRFDLTIRQPKAPGSRTIEATLAKTDGETLEVAGQIEADSGLKLAVAAKGWPADVAASGLAAGARLEGKASVESHGDSLTSIGNVRLTDVRAAGPALAGDRVALEHVTGAWDLTRGPGGWSIRRLRVDSSVGALSSDRPIPARPGEPATISGRVDLAALARQAPRALRLREGLDLRSGSVDVRADVREDAGAQRVQLTAKLSDLEAREAGREAPIVLREPATLTGAFRSQGETVRVERLGLIAAGLEAKGEGDLDRGVKVAGRFDLAALARQVRDLIDLGGIDPAGTGTFDLAYRREGASFEALYGAEIRGLKIIRSGSESFARDQARLNGEVRGAADVTGVPTSWTTARVGVGFADLIASATLTPGPRGLGVAAAWSRPATLDGKPTRLEGRSLLVWSEAALEIAELRAGLAGEGSTAPQHFVARGRYEFGSGNLALEAIPGDAGGAITPAPEGLRLTGLGGDPVVDGGIVGDLAAVDRLLAVAAGSSPYGAEGPCGLAIAATYRRGTDRVELTKVVGTSRYGSTVLSGSIREPGGAMLADLSGSLAIEPAYVDGLVASAMGPEARVKAQGGDFHVVGPLSGDILHAVQADAGLRIEGASAAGLRLGPAQVSARLEGGKVAIAPVKAPLNGGEVEIRSEVLLDAPGGAVVRLLPGTAIRGAVIDDELSSRLLSYAAPVLNDATQVRGKVSAALDGAEFPLGGPVARRSSLAGTVQFQGLEFGPGPLAAELLDLAPLKREPRLRLDETIRVRLADGRVSQEGLSVPMGRGEALTLSGSVGLDRTLALTAMVPVPVASLGGRSVEGLQDLRVPVAIGGTFARPRIDRQAMGRALKKEGRAALRKEAESGVNELIRKLGAEGGNRPKRR